MTDFFYPYEQKAFYILLPHFFYSFIMAYHSSFLKKTDYFLLTSLIILLIFPVQYVFRYLDDNRLTSWRWVSPGHDPAVIFFILVAGVIAAYLLSRYSFPERYPAAFLLSASYLSAVFFWREPEVIIDASRYFTQAKHLELYVFNYFVREWGGSINSWTDLPLVPFLYGLIFRFAGESRVFIQAFTTGLFSLTVLLTYLIGKSLWDEYTGFFAGLSLMGIPYLFTQVPLMLVDVPAMFFLTLAAFTFIMALERCGVWIVVSPPAIFLAMLSKYSTWLMLSVLLVILTVYFIRKAEDRRKVFNRALIICGITGILLLTFVLYKIDVIWAQINLLQEYQKPGLKRWGESFISTFFFQIHPLVSIYAVYSLYEAIRKKDISYTIIFCLLILVLLLQIRRARYILIVFPMLALMASYGMQGIRVIQVRRFLVYSIVVSSLVVSSLLFFPFLYKMGPVNLKDGGRYLDSLEGGSIEVLTVPGDDLNINPAASVPLLDIFTSRDLLYKYDPGFLPTFQRIKESPLRFTWEFQNPEYYTTDLKLFKENRAMVLLSNGPVSQLTQDVVKKLERYKKTRTFASTTSIFRYSPVVMIYEPDPGAD